MFLHLSVSHSVHGGGGLPDRDPPCTLKSGRYASYWNAVLFVTDHKKDYISEEHLRSLRISMNVG